MKFINRALKPKPQADLTKYMKIAFGPTNKNAMQYVDPKLQPLLSSNPEQHQGLLAVGRLVVTLKRSPSNGTSGG